MVIEDAKMQPYLLARAQIVELLIFSVLNILIAANAIIGMTPAPSKSMKTVAPVSLVGIIADQDMCVVFATVHCLSRMTPRAWHCGR